MILDENRRLLLHAAFGEGEDAISAYKSWRNRTPLDDITFGEFRILARLVQTVNRHRIEDPEIDRIKGALKHTWLSNMLRTRALAAALQAVERAGIEVMVLKGAALFARYSELAILHTVADFDMLVRQGDARKAVAALTDAGFLAHPDFRFDLFKAGDFEKIHAFPYEFQAHGGSVDLHWWPLPRWTHHGFVEELFARSEVGSIAGHRVRIPTLADHLYLTLARPEVWEIDEVFARTVEAVHILRGCAGNLDWNRVVELCRRFHRSATAEPLLALIKAELDVAIPNRVLSKLRRTRSPLSSWEFAIGHKPISKRAPREQFLVRAIALARSHPKVSRSVLRTTTALLLSRSFRSAIVVAAQENLPQQSAERIWNTHAKSKAEFNRSELNYLAGFSYPESAGRWTEGYSAALAIPVDSDITGRVQVLLRIVPLLASGKTRSKFQICASRGSVIAKVVTITDRLPWQIVIDAVIVTKAEFHGVILAFNLPDAARPSDLGLSEDTRLLGLFVQNVELCRAEDAAEKSTGSIVNG